MSKYLQLGAYHYELFAKKGDPYREHVLDLIEKIEEHVTTGGDIYEIGCGEGLIIDQLKQRGFNTEGCDVDQAAVVLGVMKGNLIRKGECFLEDREWDAVLLCDVLEHMEDPSAVMAHARSIAPVVIIAVPDRPDRHACHQINPDAVRTYMVQNGFECIHQSRRHARYLWIFKDASR